MLFLLALFGILLAGNLKEAYVCMFVIGASSSGKITVGISYMLEFIPTKQQSTVLFITMLTEPVFIIMVTFWY